MLHRTTLFAFIAAHCAMLAACSPKSAMKKESSDASHTQTHRGGAISAAASDDFLTAYASTGRFLHGRPKAISPSPDGASVLFLRSGPRSFVQDLFEFDCRTGKERVLLTAQAVLGGGEEKLTAEELARRERMRMSSRGIAAFELSKDGSKILVPLSGRLFVVDRASGAKTELISKAGFPIDPHFSPDGSMVACVRDGEVYITDIVRNTERKLTSGAGGGGGGGGVGGVGGTITNGLAEFVAQEEMSRFRGYWFSPDGGSLCYQQTDTSGMETFHIADPVHPEKEANSWPYPRAGQKNADVKLALTLVAGGAGGGVGEVGKVGAVTWISWDRATYPYVATVTWTKNAPLTILVQNRNQTEQVLLSVDEKTGATTPLLTESDSAWINIYESCPKYLEDGSGFLWVTEQYKGAAPGKDFARLELRNRDGTLKRVLTPPGFPMFDCVGLDEVRGFAYIAHSRFPTRTHVARVALSGDALTLASPVNINDGVGQFSAVFSKNHAVYVESANMLNGDVSWTVKNGQGATLGVLVSAAEQPPFVPKIELTTVGNLVGRSREYYAAITRPRNFTTSKKYPVIVQVYGGPGNTTVNAAAMGYLLPQWMADHGFIVVSIDGRGTPRRGRAWERAIKNNLIDIPLEDQADGLELLGRRYPEMDLSRVGITGWSFGGYFSAMAVMRKPGVYSCGVAGAPVCAWEDYDTHYTERYMGLPQQNPAGYAAANVLTYCKDLKVPLLIIHGTADDNVYFMHSLKMTGELFRNGKMFEFLPLAGFTHMVPDPNATKKLQERIIGFFEKHLGANGQ